MHFKPAAGIGKGINMSAFDGEVRFGADIASEVRAMRRMWAAKLLVHAKDYAAGVKIMGAKRVKDPTLNTGTTLVNARKAQAWMSSKADHPSTFIWICELFELDPERTHMQILHNWRALLSSQQAGGLPPDTSDDDDDL